MKHKKEHITFEQLQTILHYNKETGIFTWKRRGKGIKTKIAGSKDTQGYIIITINKKRYKASRLAWLYIYGYFPENQIDHKDGIRHHNWINNLREVSPQCNMRNRKVNKNNKTGVSGVCFTKGKWFSYIYINGKCNSLGIFICFDEAVCHRLAAEQCLNWNKCLKNSSAYQYVKTKIQKSNLVALKIGGFYSEPRNIVKDVKKIQSIKGQEERKKALNEKMKKNKK